MKYYRPHLLVLCVLGAVWLTGTHNILLNALADARSNWFLRAASGNIVVVAIDSPSIEKIGVWPWPRNLHAELIEKLESAGVEDIAFDVDFSSPSNQSSDDAFSTALQRAGGSIVLPVFKQKVHESVYINRPLPRFSESAWTAFVNVAADRDGVVRRYPIGDAVDGSILPSMATILAGRSKNNSSSFWIDFSILSDSIPTVSYVDVLRGDTSTLQSLRNKKVIIGGTALELADRFTIPQGRIISGPLLQALAAESILQGRDLVRVSGPFAMSGAGILMLCMIVLWRRLSAWWRAVLLVGVASAAEAAATVVQSKIPVIFDTSIFHIATAGYLLAITLDEIDFRGMLSKIADSRFEHIAMSLGDGLVCTDSVGLITVWNPGATRIFGHEADEMIGRPIGNILNSCGDHDEAFLLAEIPQADLHSSCGRVLELEGKRKSGALFPLEACFSGWQGANGFQYGAVLRDISVRKREVEKIRYLAEFDALTGLANRYTLDRHLNAEIAAAQTDQREIALVLVDLDRFKEINDTLGHAYGDRVLGSVANELNVVVSGHGLVARLGGDEFAIVLVGHEVTAKAEKLAETIVTTFSWAPISVGGRQLSLNASIGLAVYPEDGMTAEELLGNADLALYRAKAEGRGRYMFFNRQFRGDLEARLSLEAELKKASDREEFELFYQPQVDLRDCKLVGVEALIRWRHPERGLVSPAEFMPVINASSISNEIGLWVLATACSQGQAWRMKGYDVRVGVNLSPSQIQMGDLSMVVSSILAETGFSPSLLELEVTEDSVLVDEERALKNFRRLQDLGVRLAFDDFGTGYASLSYLKKFPLNVLKIDKSFVIGLGSSSDDLAIVNATIGLGKQLGLSVIAEGIEDRVTADLLLSMGCEEGQGYFYGKPMPAREFEERFLTRALELAPTQVQATAA